jgi:hypothetical protein
MTDATMSLTNRLKSLAIGVCRDAQVRVVIGKDASWSWKAEENVITVPEADLKRDPLYCLGILSHEAGHVMISRYHLFMKSSHARDKLRYLFMNGIEDPRVNEWMVHRYPGIRGWQREFTRDEFEPPNKPLLRSIRFLFECAREPQTGWLPNDCDPFLFPCVLEELNRTRDARIRYAKHLPSILWQHDAWTEQVEQRLHSYLSDGFKIHGRVLASAWEKHVLLRQIEACEISRELIQPAFDRLVERDVVSIAELLRRSPSARARALKLIQPGQRKSRSPLYAPARMLEKLNQEIFELDFQPTLISSITDGEREFATELLWRIVQGTLLNRPSCKRLGRGLSTCSTKPHSLFWNSEHCEDPWDSKPNVFEAMNYEPSYDEIFKKLQEQIRRLASDLETILRPWQRMQEQSGFASGTRVDMRRLMALDTRPERYREIWRRKSQPRQQSLAVSLLIDLSGSMSKEGKIEAALQGTVLMANVLQRLRIPFAINGFQDELIPFHPFDQAFTEAIGQTLEGMYREVHGIRDGGHNCPGENHDGPCVALAADQLLQRPERDRLLIVISDGQPSGPGSDAIQILQDTIASITRRSEIQLVGLGLGAATEHVTEYYPNAKACIEEKDLAMEISRLIRAAIMSSVG